MTIFVREDAKDSLVGLNTRIHTAFPHLTPMLNVKVSLQETGPRGGVKRNTKWVNVYLDRQSLPKVNTITKPFKATVSTSADVPPPEAGTWAAMVHRGLQGVKRVSENTSLDHRQKKQSAVDKEQHPQPQPNQSQTKQQSKQQHLKQGKQQQKQQTKAVQPQQPSLPMAAPQPAPMAPSIVGFDITATPAWKALEARNADMKRQLDEVQAKSTSMFTEFTNKMENLSTRLNEQLESTVDKFAAQLDNAQRETEELVTFVRGQQADTNTALAQISDRFNKIAAQFNAHNAILTTIAQALHIALPTPSMQQPPAAIGAVTEVSASASPAHNGQVARHG